MSIRENDRFDFVDYIGINYFGVMTGRLGYLFRKVDFFDKSIDGEIELTQGVGGTDEKIGIKVLHESRFERSADGCFTIKVTDKILYSWRNYKHPVILVVYTASDNQEMYWTRVDCAKLTTININPENKYDEKVQSALIRILLGYYLNFGLVPRPSPFSEVAMEFGQTGKGALGPLEETYKEAQVLIETGDYLGAKTIYQAMSIVYKKNKVFKLNYAISLYFFGQYDECIELCIDLLQTYKHSPMLLSLVSNCHIRIGEMETAQKYLEKAVELMPLSEELWIGIGMLYLSRGNNEMANNNFKIARRYARSSYDIDFNMALGHSLLFNNNEALEFYEKCLKINPHSYQAYNNAALILKNSWRLGDAINYFEKAIEINPDNYHAVFNLACLLKDMGNHEKAIKYYERSIELGKGVDKVYYDLACLYCRISDMDKAAYYFNKSYDYIKCDVPREEFYGAVQIIDSEYEALHLVEIEFTPDSVRIKEIKHDKKLAFFNMNSFMKESMKIINERKIK